MRETTPLPPSLFKEGAGGVVGRGNAILMKGRTLQKGKNVAAVLENLEFFKNLEEAKDRVLAEMADETISGRKYFASRNEKTF